MAHFKISAAPVMSAPNIIPMADVMLVLLIIMMVVTPMLQKGMTVEMAKVANPSDMPNADRDDAIIVGISRSGDIFLATTERRSTRLLLWFATASRIASIRRSSSGATDGPSTATW